MSFLQFWAKNMLMRFVSIVVAVTVASFAGKAEADVAFRRADANGDLRVDISDVAYTTNYLFKGSPALGSDDAGDANDDGAISLSDVLYTWNYLFAGGPPPAAPFPDTGTDPTTDSLGSTTYPSNLVNPGAALSFSGPTQVFAAPGITVEIPVSVWLTSIRLAPALVAECSDRIHLRTPEQSRLRVQLLCRGQATFYGSFKLT